MRRRGERRRKRSVFNEYRNAVSSFKGVLGSIFKYQVVTKLLFVLIIYPLFWGAVQMLIHLKGLSAVSNHNFMNFILSPQGMIFVAAGTALCFFAILIEIGGFIAISARGIHREKESGYKELLKFNIRKLPNMMEFGGVLLLIYLLVMIPLSGAGVTLSLAEGIRIPNFITSVIHENPVYRLLYYSVIAVLAGISIRWMFALHFMIIGKNKASEALKNSGRLVKKNKFGLFKYFLTVFLINASLVVVAIILFSLLTSGMGMLLDGETTLGRIFLIHFLIAENLLISAISFFLIPFEIHHLTMLFYDFCKRTEGFKEISESCPEIPEKKKASLLDRILGKKKLVTTVTVILVVLISVPMGIFFEQFTGGKREILIVGHRGGGGRRIPENSLAAIEESIEHGASYVEIDVQRTKDGAYIINHDTNFKRMAGDGRKASDMTLAEIKKLDIGKNFEGYEGERVPTIEELLDFCKGRIGIFVELKGSTADQKMADDVIRMIRERGMEKETLIMSLDYKLISYVNETYEDIETGFTYFLAFGNVGDFDSDVMILEEDAATGKALQKIHGAGKKAVVWTVNKEDSMEKFVRADVDAIITDNVKELKEVMAENEKKGTFEVLTDLFFD